MNDSVAGQNVGGDDFDHCIDGDFVTDINGETFSVECLDHHSIGQGRTGCDDRNDVVLEHGGQKFRLSRQFGDTGESESGGSRGKGIVVGSKDRNSHGRFECCYETGRLCRRHQRTESIDRLSDSGDTESGPRGKEHSVNDVRDAVGGRDIGKNDRVGCGLRVGDGDRTGVVGHGESVAGGIEHGENGRVSVVGECRGQDLSGCDVVEKKILQV